MKICVLGAAGFIGGALTDALGRDGLPFSALAGPVGAPGPPSWARGQIDDAQLIGRLVEGADVVVHLAGPPWVGRSFADPALYTRVHVTGTAVVCDAIRRAARPPHLVYVSSASVYGRAGVTPLSEDAPLRPASPYGAAKLGAEALVRSFENDFAATILRPFNVYGPGMHPETVVARVVHQLQAPQRTAVEVWDLKPVRDYLHIDDVVRGIRGAMRSRPPQTINLGRGQGTAVGALIDLAMQVSGRALEVRETGEGGAAQLFPLVADVNRARVVLHWTATTPLRAGLAQMFQTTRPLS